VIPRCYISAPIEAPKALSLLVIVLILGLLAPLSAQRRDPDPHNVEAGANLFNSICASCHGGEGDQIAGVDLGHGKFRFASTDQEIINIIRNGIPGTGMPANKMSEASAGAVVTYLHQMATDNSANTVTKGNAEHGEALYQHSGCATCHRIRQVGSRLGPDLTNIGTLRRSAILERKLTDPSGEIMPQNRLVTVVTSDGRTIRGKLMNQDTFAVLLMDESESLRSFDRSKLKQVVIEDKMTSMPSYRGKLSEQDISDLVTYLKQQTGAPRNDLATKGAVGGIVK
jgi:putative heme-binding domain-containing protein